MTNKEKFDLLSTSCLKDDTLSKRYELYYDDGMVIGKFDDYYEDGTFDLDDDDPNYEEFYTALFRLEPDGRFLEINYHTVPNKIYCIDDDELIYD